MWKPLFRFSALLLLAVLIWVFMLSFSSAREMCVRTHKDDYYPAMMRVERISMAGSAEWKVVGRIVGRETADGESPAELETVYLETKPTSGTIPVWFNPEMRIRFGTGNERVLPGGPEIWRQLKQKRLVLGLKIYLPLLTALALFIVTGAMSIREHLRRMREHLKVE